MFHVSGDSPLSVWRLPEHGFIESTVPVTHLYLYNYNGAGATQVGALQDVRSELTKLRGSLFYKVLEDLHAHLYNKGEYR